MLRSICTINVAGVEFPMQLLKSLHLFPSLAPLLPLSISRSVLSLLRQCYSTRKIQFSARIRREFCTFFTVLWNKNKKHQMQFNIYAPHAAKLPAPPPTSLPSLPSPLLHACQNTFQLLPGQRCVYAICALTDMFSALFSARLQRNSLAIFTWFSLDFHWKSMQASAALDWLQIMESKSWLRSSDNSVDAFPKLTNSSPFSHSLRCSTIREGIIRCILATDMARHNEILTQFIEITPIFDYNNRAHINLVSARRNSVWIPVAITPSLLSLAHSAALHDTY